jgi:hypothetical protein
VGAPSRGGGQAAGGGCLRAHPQPVDGRQRCGDMNTELTELVATTGATTVIAIVVIGGLGCRDRGHWRLGLSLLEPGCAWALDGREQWGEQRGSS